MSMHQAIQAAEAITGGGYAVIWPWLLGGMVFAIVAIFLWGLNNLD